mgnify:CR=1 FL=1
MGDGWGGRAFLSFIKTSLKKAHRVLWGTYTLKKTHTCGIRYKIHSGTNFHLIAQYTTIHYAWGLPNLRAYIHNMHPKVVPTYNGDTFTPHAFSCTTLYTILSYFCHHCLSQAIISLSWATLIFSQSFGWHMLKGGFYLLIIWMAPPRALILFNVTST